MGEKRPTRKGGKNLRKEKGEALRGGKALGGKGWEGSQPEKRGRILGRKRENDLRGGNALGSKRGERISTGKGWERS